MKSRRTARLAAVFGLAAALLLLVGVVVFYGFPPATAATVTPSASNKSADILVGASHVYDMPPEGTRQVAGAVGATVLGWKVADSDAATGTIHLLAPARFGLAHDEVTATILPVGKNAAVEIHSQADYRGVDFGANARHVRDLQAAMDKQLPAAR